MGHENRSTYPGKFLIGYDLILKLKTDISVFVEKLTRSKVSEVSQSEEDQKQNLQNILTKINQILDESPPRVKIKWSVDSKLFIEFYNSVHLGRRVNGAWTVNY